MRWVHLVLGILLGALLLGAARFAFLPPPEGVHYHANLAVFIDGVRLDLSGDRYMEDVAACSADPSSMRPQDRVHLHDNNGDVVHVHHVGATWGHLFSNLGLSLGDRHLLLDGGIRFFTGEEGRTLKFIVNGLQVSELQNRVLRSEDRVLISMGSETAAEVMASQYPVVASSAAEYNATQDPAGCAGGHGETTLRQRLHRAFLGG